MREQSQVGWPLYTKFGIHINEGQIGKLETFFENMPEKKFMEQQYIKSKGFYLVWNILR